MKKFLILFPLVLLTSCGEKVSLSKPPEQASLSKPPEQGTPEKRVEALSGQAADISNSTRLVQAIRQAQIASSRAKSPSTTKGFSQEQTSKTPLFDQVRAETPFPAIENPPVKPAELIPTIPRSPLPDEPEPLAQHQKAAKNVLFAFSQYFLGLMEKTPHGEEKTYHTVISCQVLIPGLPKTPEVQYQNRLLELEQVRKDLSARVATENPRYINDPLWLGVSKRESMDDLKKDLARIEGLIEELKSYHDKPDEYETEIRYLQIGNVGQPEYSKRELSSADEFNGITYRGEVRFHFGVFRFFVEKEGWTEWKDYSNEAFSSANRTIKGGSVNCAAGGLPLYFTVIERDKNWFVKAINGDEFVNGKLTKSGQLRLLPPTKDFATAIVSGAKNLTRESYRTMGEAVRSNPAALEQSQIETMKMVGGPSLFQ